MISVCFFKNEGGVRGFECKGHAGYAESGSDIVCAAVSMLVINTINSIESFTGCDFTCSQDEKKGSIYFMLKGNGNEKSRVLIDALMLGLKHARDEYGNDYIQIKIKETEDRDA